MFKNVIIAILSLTVFAGVYEIVSNPQIKAALTDSTGTKNAVTQTPKNASKQKQAVQSVRREPTVAQAVAMVQRSMQNFSLSLKQGNMQCFYNNIADFWKQKTSPAKLDKVFAPFIKGKIDLSGLQKLRPVLVKGSGLLKNGDLLLVGYYAASNAVLQFREIYRYEPLNGWRLIEFVVQIDPKKPAAASVKKVTPPKQVQSAKSAVHKTVKKSVKQKTKEKK